MESRSSQTRSIDFDLRKTFDSLDLLIFTHANTVILQIFCPHWFRGKYFNNNYTECSKVRCFIKVVEVTVTGKPLVSQRVAHRG